MGTTGVLLASVAALALPSTALAMDGVVASIKPLHSLVAGVMEGVGEPELLVEGASSPHTYAMRPSDAAALEDAALVFWIGEGLETFLPDALESLASDAETVALEDARGLAFLEFREGGAYETDSKAGDGRDERDREESAETDPGDEEEHVHRQGYAFDDDHDHGAYDMHLWLDPENATAMVEAIEAALAGADPENAARYRQNAEALTARLDALSKEIAATLAPVADRPFVVFHDAYHYFEDRFGLEAAGAVTVSPEIGPGAERIAQMQETVRALDAACVFSEPQFEPRTVELVAEGSNATSGVLDPMGADLEGGPELYFDLMRNMATSFADCLSPEG